MILDVLLPDGVEDAEMDERTVLARVHVLLSQALAVGVATRPVALRPDGRRLRMRLSARMVAAVTMSQRQRPRPTAQVVAELMAAGLELERKANAARPEDLVADPSESPSWRPDQEMWLRDLQRLLHTHPRALIPAEAATGLGKSRVLACLAVDALSHATADAPVVVAAPTLSVLQHLIGEALAFDRATVDAHAHVLLGRAQFVDVAALDAFLADLPPALISTPSDRAVVEAVRAWRSRGGPAVPDAPTHVLHRTTPSLAWLLDDLMETAPAWPRDEFALQPDALPNPGLEAWRRHVDGARAALWVFTTHALLASDVRYRRFSARRSGAGCRLPHIGTLLLDEAHKFDGVLAETVGHDVAVSRVVADLRAIEAEATRTTLILARAARLAATTVLETTMAAPGAQRVMLAPGALHAAEWRTVHGALASLVESLRGLAQSGRRKIDTDRRVRLLDAVTALQHVLAGRQWVALDRSPVRRWPSFAVGASSLKHDYERLWAAVDRAVLTSATLTLPTGGPSHGRAMAQSYDLMARDLWRLPAHRRVDAVPMNPAWVIAGVQLHIPAATPAVRDALTPPRQARLSDADAGAENVETLAGLARERWWHHVARLLAGRIQPTAYGGTLVLCASYEDVAGIARQLRDAGLAADVLLEQKPTGSLKRDRQEFIRRAHLGLRPIWCATGSAWTGLDCRDPLAATAADDRVLTDLVIPRIPWKQNRSLVHAARTRRNELKYEGADTAFRLRQGIGRLVRRDGLRHRRLWVLDARCWASVDTTRAAYYRLVRNVLSGYMRQVIDDVPDWPARHDRDVEA